MKMFHRIKKLVSIGNTINGVFSENEFHTIFKYERARSDRNKSEFSLVIFEVGKPEGENLHQIERFAKLLKKRQRNTDAIGWFNDTGIAVLLPYTGFDGAKIYSESIDDIMLKNSVNFRYLIYCYPSKKRWKHENIVQNDIVQSDEELPKSLAHPIPTWKRVFDVMATSFFLIIGAPILLLAGIYIKIVSPGPIFFTQKRVGYRGKLFTILKLRTMKPNSEDMHKKYADNFIKGNQKLIKLDKSDSRIIPGGKLIRKACIDELPQLFNVLIGDMSLVGPRPCIPYEESQFIQWHRQRFNTLPGLTGLWQVSGKEKLSFQQMIRLDITYAQKKSFFLDLKIILLTIPTILRITFGPLFEKLLKADEEAA